MMVILIRLSIVMRSLMDLVQMGAIVLCNIPLVCIIPLPCSTEQVLHCYICYKQVDNGIGFVYYLLSTVSYSPCGVTSMIQTYFLFVASTIWKAYMYHFSATYGILESVSDVVFLCCHVVSYMGFCSAVSDVDSIVV